MIHNLLIELYNNAANLLTTTIQFLDTQAKILILLINAIIAWFLAFQKLTYKLEISYRISSPRYSQEYISSIVVSNKRDRSTSIWAIYLCVNKETMLVLARYDTPIIIKPYETATINLPKFSKLLLNDEQYAPDYLNDHLQFKIDIGKKTIECEVLVKKNPKNHHTIVNIITAEFDGVVYDETVKYIIKYYYKNKGQIALIDQGGFIGPEWNFTPNYLANRTSVAEIKNLFISSGLHRIFDSYACYSVHNLRATEEFNKSSIDDLIKERSKI